MTEIAGSYAGAEIEGGQGGAFGRYAIRTPERPMAFTQWELVRGAAMAWVVFLFVAPPVLVVVAVLRIGPGRPDTFESLLTAAGSLLPAVLLVAIIGYLPWSLGALLVLGMPLAHLLGTALRRVRDRWVHVVAFGALGALVGSVTTLIAQGPAPASSSCFPVDQCGSPGLVIATNAVVCALCVALGWWFTSSRALQSDARAATGEV